MVVEAIEECFIPVLIHNNRKGKDAELLKHFNEPAWNNPVVRYLDADEKDLIERKDGVWTTTETVQRMLAALTAAKLEIPSYLSAFATSKPTASTQAATFAMHCYWEGEAKLGSIDGVHSTRSGWKDSLEVVTLTYDPQVVDYEKLVDTAKSFECASKVYAHTREQLKVAKAKVGKDAIAIRDASTIKDAKASDQKYYLIQTPLRHLPMSETQATKINSALKSRQSFESLLSPKQQNLLRRIIAVSKNDRSALTGFQFPADLSKLAAYSEKLNEKLNELEKK